MLETKPMEQYNSDEVGKFRTTGEYDDAHNPKCPHCGHIYDIQEEEAWNLYDECPDPVKCPVCEIGFEVEVTVTYLYTTSNQNGEVWEN